MSWVCLMLMKDNHREPIFWGGPYFRTRRFEVSLFFHSETGFASLEPIGVALVK